MFLQAGDLCTHVQVEGPPGAPALLLLHSLGTTLHLWDAQAAVLARSFRVIRADMRGHGLSAVTPGPYRIEGLADDALAVLDALGVERAHVAGISIGGLIAQSIAARAPERVLSLALCDTALVIPTEATWRERAATVRARGMAALVEGVLARWVTPGFAGALPTQGLRAMLLRTDPEGYAGAAEAIAVADLTAATQGFGASHAVPALVLVGAADEATPLSSAEALCRALPGARLVVVPDAAHIPTAEQPEAVTAAILSLLTPDAVPAEPAQGGLPTQGGLPGFAAGLATRRAVLGEAHVARSLANAEGIDAYFQRWITEGAWGGVWSRPHFDRRTRSIVTLALLAGLGREEEFRLHLRATANTGASPEDVAELLLHVGVYAGVPAANSAMRILKDVLKELVA